MEKLDRPSYEHVPSFFYRRFVKRTVDIIGSSFLLLFLFPVILIFSVTLLIFSGRPIFYKQLRAGLYDQPFFIWKFRTMQAEEIESSSHKYEWKDEVPQDFEFTTPQTLSITKIGKIYRKYSIDEIPQLWNVLKGEMSVVGPRPEMIEITKHYSSTQKKRLQVKPGITGYAQVNGRSAITHGEKIAYDLYYVKHCSFFLDLKILLQTVYIVITGKGAW
ncbi:Sugar transferase involved in LPS biosynthesis (colanic, teichoic acid) [Psychrobacillus sp. OK028]|uniref:sugar transferase n=1 Tax=Psychrobacillus sp. OK028 TaxID=1884359 RepID=UPI000890CE75|nr:sugar transferase [Psychrobacillus sp. OK028]SDO01120.1 Sugar transferase involved in LPS biosynthesis (colanic, teichoic acid) [Psychrobacillus sp. OK028]